jgi:hypothetical protein
LTSPNGANFAQVQYRRVGTQSAVRVGVAQGNLSGNPTIQWGTWTNVTTATNYALVLNYTQGAAGTATVTVNGGAAINTGAATRNTNAYAVASVKVGAITSPGVAMTIEFDSFSSARAPF